MRRLVALSLLVPSLIVPLVGSAHAAAPPATGDSVLVVQDGSFYRGNADLTDYDYASANLVGTDGTDGYGMRASADGSRFVYALDRSGPHAGDLTSRIVVRDASGRLVRYVDGQHGTFTDDVSRGSVVDQPSLTPDGNQVVYTLRDAGGTSLRRGLIGTSGAGVRPVPNSSGLEAPVAMTNGLAMLALKAGTVYGVTPLGTRRLVTGLPAGAVISYAVSPDGSKLVYEHTVPGGRAFSVATLTPGTYPAYSAGPSTTLVAKVLGTDPGFSHDGTTVYWSEGSDIWSVPVGGGTATNLTHDGTTKVQSNVVGVTLDEGTAPAPVTDVSITLSNRPVVHWALPADPDLSGVSLVRTAPNLPTLVRFLPAPVTSFQELDLPGDLSTTYTYTLTAVDRSGHASAKATRQMQERSPRLGLATPTTTTGANVGSSDATFRVGMPLGTYNLSVRTNGTGPFVRIATGGSGNFTFGKDLGTTSKAGDSYTFRVQVFDDFGNASLATLQSPATVPYDDASFTYTGPTRLITASKAFFGKEHVLLDGSSATFTAAKGNLIVVMGALCNACRSLDMYVNGRRVGLAHGYLASPEVYHDDRVALIQFSTVTFGPGPYTVKLVARGGKAIVDGIAFRR